MTTYNSYEAAKIANPESVIYKASSGNYATNEVFNPGLCTVIECNPVDHCMTNNEFIEKGHRIVIGDIVLDEKRVVTISDHNNLETYNSIVEGDDTTFILRAAALQEKKPRTKVEYVKVTDSIFDLRPDFEAGELYFRWLGNSEQGSGGVGYDKITTESMLLCRYEEGRLLRRRIETPMTEREAFIEALQSVWVIDGVDGQEQLEKIVNSGLFKLVN